MTKQVFWTSTIVDTLIREGGIHGDLEMILRLHAEGESITAIAEKMHMSKRTVDNRIAELKAIWDYCASRPGTDLPPRALNKDNLIKSFRKV